MSARAVRSLAVLLALAAPRAALAGRCVRPYGPVRGPITLNAGVGASGELGTSPSACASTGWLLEERLALYIDLPQFRGRIDAATVLTASYAPSANFWLTAAVTPVRWTRAINATITSDAIEFGGLTVGAHGVVVRTAEFQLAAYVHVLLPLDSGSRYRYATGFEPGASMLWAPTNRVALNAGLSLPVTIDVLGERALWRFTPRTWFDVAFTPTTWFEFAVGGEARFGTDPAGALEYVAPKAALRFFPGRSAVLQLAFMAPLGGLEQTNYRASLGFGGQW